MEFIQQHWGIVAANPWLFVTWSLVVATTTWAIVHFLYRRRIDDDAIEIQRLSGRIGEMKDERLRRADAPLIVPAAIVRENSNSPQYEPDGLAIRVLGMLRLADGKWTTVDQMSRFLEVGSQQDLRQALKDLRARKWIEAHRRNFGLDDGSKMYRLDSLGIEFARKQGFETITEIERKKDMGS